MNAKNPYNAYRQATHTVSKTRQVVMLYEGVLRNLLHAREAIEQKNIELRYNKLCKASEIIIGLQMSLDFTQGEEAAQALYDFYADMDSRIMQLHRSQNLQRCDEIIRDLKVMLEVWKNIDHTGPEAVSALSNEENYIPAGQPPAQKEPAREEGEVTTDASSSSSSSGVSVSA